MKFLHLHDYKKTMVSPVRRVEPVAPIDEDLKLVQPFLKEMGLTSEGFLELEKSYEYESGDEKFRHSLLWSNSLQAHFVVIKDCVSGKLHGYTCQDIEAQDKPCKLISPFLEDDYAADAELIDELLDLLDRKPEDRNAFVVMESGGCYIQTARDEDGFVLEYQAVAKEFHFVVPEKLAVDDVKKAFHSFNEGDDKWSYCLEWEHLEL